MTPKQEKLIENYVRQKVKKMLKEGNRIEDVADVKYLKEFKEAMRLLVSDWRRDGFDDTDILRYLNKLLQQI